MPIPISCALSYTDQERQEPPLEPRPENHPAPRLCHQPEPSLAGREGLRMAEADRPNPPGEAARTAQGGLAVRLQLRRAQLVQAAQADRTKTCGKVPAELRLKTLPEPETALQRDAKGA